MIWAIVYFMGNLVLEQVKINQNTFRPRYLSAYIKHDTVWWNSLNDEPEGQNITIKISKIGHNT